MNLLNRFYNWVLAALVILALALAVLWQHSKNEVTSLNLDIAKLEQAAVKTKVDNLRILEKQKADNALALEKAKTQYAQNVSLLEGKLRNVENQYRDNVLVTNRLRKRIGELNDRVSSLSRTQLETYATTGANNLAECSDVTVELESLARRYYEEREFYRTNWPVVPPPVITVTDLKSGATLELGSAVKVKAKVDDFEPVVP